LFARYEPDGRPRRVDFTVRAARLVDAAALAEIRAEREADGVADLRVSFEAALRLKGEDNVLLVAASPEGRVLAYGSLAWLGWSAPEPGCVPEGWYLTGVVVAPGARRGGLGLELTRARLGVWTERSRGERESPLRFVVNARNLVSIDLHAKLGFELEADSDAFHMPGVTFTGGRGLLFVRSQPG
jgi:ribosomal protein S18 acetylase RimI-like enzyme